MTIFIDSPGPGEVLVEILASGVCHTDLHLLNRKESDEPILLGHEGTGIVLEVGSGVSQPQVGDKVILAWRAPCGDACAAFGVNLVRFAFAALLCEQRGRDG